MQKLDERDALIALGSNQAFEASAPGRATLRCQRRVGVEEVRGGLGEPPRKPRTKGEFAAGAPMPALEINQAHQVTYLAASTTDTHSASVLLSFI